MNITIAGGGNIGTQLAVHAAEKLHSVTVYTSKPDLFQTHLTVVDKAGSILHEGDIHLATHDPRAAFENADVVFVTLPAFCMKEIAAVLLPYARKGMTVFLVPGTGGGECAFREHLEKGVTVAGLQRVPSVARLRKYGESVCATGYRNELFTAALPKSESPACAKFIEGLMDMKTSVLPDYLNLTLTPSNPVLHTSRLYTLFKDYHEGVSYPSLPLFYEEWSDETTELLFKLDAEVQNICKAMPEFDLSYVKSLKIHYENDTVRGFTDKIRSIEGFKGLPTPSVQLADGTWIPDLTSRYFTADFSYGLTILDAAAGFLGINTPYIRQTLSWYEKIKTDTREEYRFEDYGITGRESFLNFYRR